jgi:hypothetical protein
LTLANETGRVLIAHNLKDFPDILREWADEGREHCGCIILVGVRLERFGAIIRSIEAALETEPDQTNWAKRSLQVGRN